MTDHIFYIRHILEKKWEYKGTVHQLFIDFKKAYDSVRREVLCNILIEFRIPRELVGLINPLKTKLFYILFKTSVCTSERPPHFTITKITC
jgi:hypothetical protein